MVYQNSPEGRNGARRNHTSTAPVPVTVRRSERNKPRRREHRLPGDLSQSLVEVVERTASPVPATSVELLTEIDERLEMTDHVGTKNLFRLLLAVVECAPLKSVNSDGKLGFLTAIHSLMLRVQSGEIAHLKVLWAALPQTPTVPARTDVKEFKRLLKSLGDHAPEDSELRAGTDRIIRNIDQNPQPAVRTRIMNTAFQRLDHSS